MKIVFMGTPDFAVYSLKALYEAGHEILCVISQPDKPKGRGKKLQPTPVKQYAESVGLTVYQPDRIKSEEFTDFLATFDADFFVVVAYGQILSKKILDMPKKACINVHGSLLPKYRGAAPIQWSVINGDKVTGITTMLMGEECDAGDMLKKAEVSITADDTYATLHDKLAPVGAELLVETINLFDKITPIAQDEAKVTYAPMINKELGRIDWNLTKSEIISLVRGLNPAPGAFFTVGDERIKVFKAKSYSDNIGEVGKVICSDSKTGLVISCKDGELLIEELQAVGGKIMSSSAYLRGHSIASLN